MAEIPVERKERAAFPWWLIPLGLLGLLLPMLYFCNKPAVVDNTNGNGNRNVSGANGANTYGGRAANSSVTITNGTTTVTSANGTVTVGADGVSVNRAANGGSNVAVVVNNTEVANGAAQNREVIKDVNEFGTAQDKSTLVGRGFLVNGVRVNRVLSDKVFTVKSGTGEMFVMLDNNLDSAGGKEQQIKMRRGQLVNLGGEFRDVPTAETTQETQGGGLNKNEYAQLKGQQVYLHANSVSDAK